MHHQSQRQPWITRDASVEGEVHGKGEPRLLRESSAQGDADTAVGPFEEAQLYWT
ncbi:hypothetical protein Cni_G19966 [Canna indica]|uniref:Uncharacterized protein n=1 Tax=Canna indica TaxID=4628 RepID=A0AAQ3QHE0_9LILI|nr:hypothetical protein Cni_G19966 [Canna indica]